MGPPRRTRENSNLPLDGSNATPSHTASNRPQRTPKPSISLPPPPTEPNLGMTPASRYNHNLKVLRRRDPSIVSIFDQFSHVCVYHHNGKKWEKQGFEGSMFLYERESYPPYGFYILNRMGMDDYIQRLYPEDDIGAHGSYLMLRSYPEFTSRRLSAAHTSTELPHKFADIYAVPTPEKLLAKDKGFSQTVGLWMFATDAREPMIDVLLRLHSFIKKNIPYPEEFRYGPDRPPPPNPHLRTTPSDDDTSTSTSASDADSDSRPHKTSKTDHRSTNPSQTYVDGGASELDKLFAKLSPTDFAQLPSANSTSKMTVESLFAALGGNEIVNSTASTSNTDTAGRASSSPSPKNRGLALLDSIFASATPPPPNPNINGHLITSSPRTPSAHITSLSSSSRAYLDTKSLPNGNAPISSAPSPSTFPHPQVLTQDVISTLLGLGHGPSSLNFLSASHPHKSSHSGSSSQSFQSQALSRSDPQPHSHPHSFPHSHSRASSAASASRYSGDNEGSDDSASGSASGYSESSTVLDPDADGNVELQSAGASAGQPLLALLPVEPDISGAEVFDEQGDGAGRVNGDVTPRPGLRAIGSTSFGRSGPKTSTPPTVAATLAPRKRVSQSHLLITPSGSASRLQIVPSNVLTASPSTETIRPSAPNVSLPSLSDPHAPAPIRSLIPFEADSELWPYPRAPLDDRALGDDADILELDFADTRALSDPEVFKIKMLEKGKGRRQSNGTAADDGGRVPGEDTERTRWGHGSTAEGASGTAKERKKGKKERAADRERERQEIEKSWDVPGQEVLPTLAPTIPPQTRGPILPAPTGPEPVVNGTPIRQPTSTPPAVVNGIRKEKGTTALVDRDAACESIINAVTSSSSARNLPLAIERNEFVREVLTLIHTDKTFVDSLWRDYMTRPRKVD